MNHSEYCKICKRYDGCDKPKTCSCTDFATDVEIRIKRKK